MSRTSGSRPAEESAEAATSRRGGASWGGRRLAAIAIAVVVVTDLVALAAIVTARREAEQAAVEELSQRTVSQARAIEALLATLRADLAFLGSSSRLAGTPDRLASDDPLSRRWARLDAEGTLLLFAQGHRPLVSIELVGPQEDRLATVVRAAAPDGVAAEPTLVREAPTPEVDALGLTVPVEGGGTIRASVAPGRLLAEVLGETSGSGSEAALVRADDEPAQLPAVVARETIDTRGWEVAAPIALERRVGDGPLLAAVERLASRWRLLVLLNVAVISLGLPLVVLTVRTARRAARLAAEREHAEHRRSLERRLWEQERLATVGRLAASIAHEINNPLAGMSNHLTLLEEELAAGDVSGARRRAPRVAQGVERIRRIVQRALRLVNPSGTAREPLDLVALAEETVALVASPGQAARVRIVVDGDGGAVRVEGDRGMLGQLLTNLLLNALDFGGEEPVEVHLAEHDEECSIVVQDRGPGIAPTIAERLFEPFVSSRGSTGLGLAVCLGVVREHGGTIVGENRPGGGARFEVRLPRHESGEPAARERQRMEAS